MTDAWIHAFITELCKLHPEVLDWPSHEMPNIIEQIRGQTPTTEALTSYFGCLVVLSRGLNHWRDEKEKGRAGTLAN